MVTSSQNRYEINGFVDTSQQVWNNIEELASAANSFITYNSQLGQYAVVINEPTDSSFSFDDDNIISDIDISQSNISQTYNGGEITFNNKEILGHKDSVRFLLDLNTGYGDYEAREAKNWLQTKSPYINDYIQAQLVLATEIKQSREDLNVTFSTDYSAIGITAGDVIDITNDIFDWDQKLFRVIEISEVDDDEGNIVLELVCISYSTEQYDYTGFSKLTKTPTPAIQPIKANEDVQENSIESVGIKVGESMQTTVGRNAIIGAGIPQFQTLSGGFSKAECEFVLNAGSGGPNNFNLTAPLNAPAKLMSFQIQQPFAIAPFDITVGGTTKTIAGGTVPVYYTLRYSTIPNDPSAVIINAAFLNMSSYGAFFSVADAPAGYYSVYMQPPIWTEASATPTDALLNSGLVAADFKGDANGFAAALTVQAFLN